MIYLWILHTFIFILVFNYLSNRNLGKVLIFKENILPDIKRGQLLFNQLIGYREIISEFGKNLELFKYKYFTDMTLNLVKATKKFGSPIDFAIQELKVALSKDISLETKIKSQFLGALFQMLMISIMGFTFFYFSSLQLGLKVNPSDVIVVFLVQLFGLFIFILSFIKLKSFHFISLENYLKSMYQLRSLAFSGLGIKSVLEESQLDILPKKKNIIPLHRRIMTVFKMVQKYGNIDTSEFNTTINELWQLIDIEFEQFLKHLAALKTLVIISFFLGSYLYLIFNLLAGLKL